MQGAALANEADGAQVGAAILVKGSVSHVANNSVFGFLHLAGDVSQGLWFLGLEFCRTMGET